MWTLLRDMPGGTLLIPGTGGVEIRVVTAGVVASTARAVIETPLELIKVRRQVNQPWVFRQLFTGFGVSWLRTTGLMTTFFILVQIAFICIYIDSFLYTFIHIYIYIYTYIHIYIHTYIYTHSYI